MRNANNSLNAAPVQFITLNDIYYIVFRNKTKIILCSILGLVAGAFLFLKSKPSFSSEARLFIRYVEKATTAASLTEDTRNRNSDVNVLSERADGIIASELQILTSHDLIIKAVEKIGPEKFIENLDSVEDPALIPVIAAGQVLETLAVQVPRGSSIISLSFTHRNPNLVQPVLKELIDQYLIRHLETHRTAGGALSRYLAQQTDQYRARLNQTKEELRREMAKAGIESLEEGSGAKLEQLLRLPRGIFATPAALAEHEASSEQDRNLRHEQLAGQPLPNVQQSDVPVLPTRVDPLVESEYRRLITRIDALREEEASLLVQFSPLSTRVKGIQSRIAELEVQRKGLEQDHPLLVQVTNPVTGMSANTATVIDPRTEATRIAALKSRLAVLTEQRDMVQAELDKASQGEIVINELLRRIELDESNYNNFLARLEQERINESFGSGKVNGINIVETPTPPLPVKSKAVPLAAGAVIGGLLAGIAWAFLMELYLDTSVKRPNDIQKSVDIPLFLSIPDESKNIKTKPKQKKSKQKMLDRYFDEAQNAKDQLSTVLDTNGISQNTASPLYPFYEALRDRLIGFFESRNLVHSPKLIGLTGLGESPGVTTLASGLASCLSKTEEGNVLLVDMTMGQESSRQYYKGKEVCDLDAALETNSSAHVDGNLFVVKESSNHGNDSNLPRVLPRRFSHIIPKLKASDFDYIIFDMPEISPISVTPRLASFMDAMLMVVESEKTDKSVLKLATNLMEQSNANLGVVLNKTKTYGPKFLQEQFFGSS